MGVNDKALYKIKLSVACHGGMDNETENKTCLTKARYMTLQLELCRLTIASSATAARERLRVNTNSLGWVAAAEAKRSPFASLRENAALSGSCLPSAPLRENQA